MLGLSAAARHCSVRTSSSAGSCSQHLLRTQGPQQLILQARGWQVMGSRCALCLCTSTRVALIKCWQYTVSHKAGSSCCWFSSSAKLKSAHLRLVWY
jgi:hypothetical protein